MPAIASVTVQKFKNRRVAGAGGRRGSMSAATDASAEGVLQSGTAHYERGARTNVDAVRSGNRKEVQQKWRERRPG